MGLPRACTLACSLVLLLSVSSAQSIAADEPMAVTGAAETLTPAATIHAQSHFLAFSNVILPVPSPAPRVAAGLLFAQSSWLMPLPDFSVSEATTENKSATTSSHTANIALADPTDSAPDQAAKPTTAERDSEPFGLSTARAPQGLLWIKWRKVQRAIEAETPALARCRTSASRCSQAIARFVAIVAEAAKRDGRSRLELVNERINYAIRYVADEKQWHQRDHWSAPFDRHHRGSFETGMGDCEDYAIAKYVALLETGTPARDLRLLMVRDTTARTDHAVLAAHLDGHWLVLDNRWRRLIPDNEAQFFRPLFALNAAGVTRFAAAGGDRRSHIKSTAKTSRQIVLAGESGLTHGDL